MPPISNFDKVLPDALRNICFSIITKRNYGVKHKNEIF